MRIHLWHGVNNESWRELVTGDDDMLRQEAADELRRDVVHLLENTGHDTHVAYRQTRGAFVICQTPEADDIVAEAIQKSLEACERQRDRETVYVIAGPMKLGNLFGYFGHKLPEGKYAVVIDGEYTNGGYGPSLAIKDGVFSRQEDAQNEADRLNR